MAREIIIRSEDDAWLWLRAAMNSEIESDEPVSIRFEGWPTLDLHYRGPDFDSSVPTRIMPSLIDAQREIHRLYCHLQYGTPNLQRLTNADRDRLELVVRVDEGSSELSTNLADALTQAANTAVSHMESTHILIAILGGALTWGSVAAWKAWVNARAQERGVDARVEMSQLEKDKLEAISKAMSRAPEVGAAVEGADEFRNSSLHKLKAQDSFDLPNSDFQVDGEYASLITRRQREEAIEKRIDGQFVILAVASGSTSGFRIQVSRMTDGFEVNVTIPEGALTYDQQQILQHNEWRKRPFYLSMNARVLRGRVTSASLVSVSEISANDETES